HGARPDRRQPVLPKQQVIGRNQILTAREGSSFPGFLLPEYPNGGQPLPLEVHIRRIPIRDSQLPTQWRRVILGPATS
ncbi:MAG: hypothetical protein RLZZ582_1049, partial [Verrucomicrobiota bacterium]